MHNDVLQSLKTEFVTREFLESDASANPFEQFEAWFENALGAEVPEPNAMVLATASADGKPSARFVLLRNLDDRGFVFFTNYSSRKGQEMLENPHVQLLFYWHLLGRQIRIEGRIEKVTTDESWEYFSSRPLESRIGAWASRQSSVIANREALENEFKKYQAEFQDKEVPMPEYWGGYRVLPSRMEFWQGRESRLHDRIVYTAADGVWKIQRLSP